MAAAGLLLASDASAQEPGDWEFFGAARLRAEFNDTNAGSDRHRQRIRVRAGAKYRINEELLGTFRASTGPDGNPRSGYHDIGQSFDRMDFWLDQYYLTYTPESQEGLMVMAGKFPNPVYRTPFYGELVWDADLQPEGAAVAYQTGELGPFDSNMFAIGQTAVIEQANSEDAWATMLMWHGAMATGEDRGFDFGANYYFYGDLTPNNNPALLGTGNAVAGGDFVSEFGVGDGIVVYHQDNWQLSAEFIKNFRADDSVGDSGFALGGGIDTDMGAFYYQYQGVEQDALLAAVAQDDFLYSTNYTTHVVGWKRPIWDNVKLHIWLQASELEDDMGLPDDTVYRFRIDLDVLW